MIEAPIKPSPIGAAGSALTVAGELIGGKQGRILEGIGSLGESELQRLIFGGFGGRPKMEATKDIVGAFSRNPSPALKLLAQAGQRDLNMGVPISDPTSQFGKAFSQAVQIFSQQRFGNTNQSSLNAAAATLKEALTEAGNPGMGYQTVNAIAGYAYQPYGAQPFQPSPPPSTYNPIPQQAAQSVANLQDFARTVSNELTVAAQRATQQLLADAKAGLPPTISPINISIPQLNLPYTDANTQSAIQSIVSSLNAAARDVTLSLQSAAANVAKQETVAQEVAQRVQQSHTEVHQVADPPLAKIAHQIGEVTRSLNVELPRVAGALIGEQFGGPFGAAIGSQIGEKVGEAVNTYFVPPPPSYLAYQANQNRLPAPTTPTPSYGFQTEFPTTPVAPLHGQPYCADCDPQNRAIRAQKEQVQRDLQREQLQLRQKAISSQQQTIERLEETEKLPVEYQRSQDIQDSIRQKQQLLAQLDQELSDLEKQRYEQAGVQMEQSQFPPPAPVQYPPQPLEPAPQQQQVTQQPAQASQQSRVSPPAQQTPVTFCIGCETQYDAFAFMNGEPSSKCAVIPPEGVNASA